LDSEELVEFLTVLPTDILDEDEKTYGPFNVNDVALLPKSIVRILKNNNVVNIIK
jgi:DNA replication factor GINS